MTKGMLDDMRPRDPYPHPDPGPPTLVEQMRARLYAMDLTPEQVDFVGQQVARNPYGAKVRVAAMSRAGHRLYSPGSSPTALSPFGQRYRGSMDAR